MREIYLKIKQDCELPKAMLTYSYKDFDGVIHPFGKICVDFKEDDEINIKKMEDVKQKYGSFFMFFNNSDEGIEFWKSSKINIEPKG